MALKATIYKAELHVSDMDRGYYATHSLVLALHPSETEERMMLRVLAFALNADDELMFGKGISKTGEIIDMGVELNIIKKSGSWFSYAENKLGQGRDAVRQLLDDNLELCEELEQKIKEAVAKSGEPVVA